MSGGTRLNVTMLCARSVCEYYLSIVDLPAKNKFVRSFETRLRSGVLYMYGILWLVNGGCVGSFIPFGLCRSKGLRAVTATVTAW